jgi:hypothetical protein
MAKQRKLLPAHRREAVDDSVLIRSAETLGRMIGSLHRQLDSAKKRFSGPAVAGVKRIPLRANGHNGGNGSAEVTRAKPQGRKRTASTRHASSAATKKQPTADRKSKRPSKSARAMKKK